MNTGRCVSPVSVGVYSLRKAALAQLVGAVAVAAIIVAMLRLAQVDPAGIALILAMLQGGIAAMVAYRQNAPPWWLFIHLGFAPLVVLVQRLNLSSAWFLAGFILLLLVFWRTDKSRVPLYLSNRATAAALLKMLPKAPCQVIDLGCGDGGLLRRLARARPDCNLVGIEHAPLPWLLARLTALRLPNLAIRRGDFWAEPLNGYGFVYAFLSPAPMMGLWEKAQSEMSPGAMLVSNSFAVPDVGALSVISVGDRRGTRLYCYRPNQANDFTAFPAIPSPPDRE